MTAVERQQVQMLLLQLAERAGGWDELMDRARVPRSTHPAWRYGEEPTTPQAAHLLRILRAAGVLGDDLLLVGEPPPGLTESEKAAWVKEQAEEARRRAGG